MNIPLVLKQTSTVEAEGKKFGIRAGAYIIDTVFNFIVNLIIQFVIGIVVGIALAINGREFTLDERSPLWVITGIALSILYFALFEWLYGATPGKLILDMRVIKENGEPCNLGAALIRGLLRFIDGLFFAIPALVSMDEPLYQRIGDKAAKTIVVSSKDAIIQRPRKWWQFLIAAGIYIVLEAIVYLVLTISLIR